MLKSYLILPILVILAVSCQKKKAASVDPDFVRTWRFIEHSNRIHYISIGEDSRGSYTVYDSLGNYLKWSSDMQRKWLIKKDILRFGWTSMKEQEFHIDQYPEKAEQTIFIPYDTIEAGQYYMILDGHYFAD